MDEIFWLEEERVISNDWVVRHQNRLLQLERQTRHWGPAKSRVLVRQNESGQIQIRYRGQLLAFQEIAASTRIGEGRALPLPPRPPSPNQQPTAA